MKPRPNAPCPIIRPMQRSDLPAILSIQKMVYQSCFHEDFVAFQSKYTVSGDTCFLAEYNGKAAGYVFSLPICGYDLPPLNVEIAALPTNPDRLYLHDMALLPEARGQGLAAGLLQEVIRAARKRHLEHIVLIAVQNSAAFWNSHGFESNPTATGKLQAKLVSYGPEALYMEQRINRTHCSPTPE